MQLLGPLEVDSGGERVAAGGLKQRAVLALLAVRADTVVSRDEFHFPESQRPATATTTVQVYISRLRKLLGAGAIVSEGGGFRLCLDDECLDSAPVSSDSPQRGEQRLRRAERSGQAAT